MTGRVIRWLALAAAAVAWGCSGPPADPPPADTGARDAARQFAETVVRRDWAAAQAGAAPNGWPAAEFARRGEGYSKRLGFEPSAVRVRSGDEHGDEATVHLVIAGRGHGRHTFEEAMILRRRDGGWRLVLPPTFGVR